MAEVQILGAFPNAFLPSAGETLVIKGISEEEARAIASHSPTISYVGHTSTAQLFAERLGIPVEVNRGQADPKLAILVGSFIPPRRLQDGEAWTEEEILSMPIRWLRIG